MGDDLLASNRHTTGPGLNWILLSLLTQHCRPKALRPVPPLSAAICTTKPQVPIRRSSRFCCRARNEHVRTRCDLSLHPHYSRSRKASRSSRLPLRCHDSCCAATIPRRWWQCYGHLPLRTESGKVTEGRTNTTIINGVLVISTSEPASSGVYGLAVANWMESRSETIFPDFPLSYSLSLPPQSLRTGPWAGFVPVSHPLQAGQCIPSARRDTIRSQSVWYRTIRPRSSSAP